MDEVYVAPEERIIALPKVEPVVEEKPVYIPEIVEERIPIVEFKAANPVHYMAANNRRISKMVDKQILSEKRVRELIDAIAVKDIENDSDVLELESSDLD